MSTGARAILARFRGNLTDACDYCETMARTYASLTHEYRTYREELLTYET